jgi:glycosyltransferase involved in cell wall biosynthesis
VLVDLAQAAPAADMHVEVVSLAPTATAPHALRLRRLGVPVHDAGGGFRRAVGAVAATRPDIVHAHLKTADLIGAVAAARLEVPLVSTLHLIEDAVTPLGLVKREVAKHVRVRRAATTVAVSDALRRWYLASSRADPRRTVTVRNGVLDAGTTADARRRVRGELGLTASDVAAVMVAVMRPGKGHQDLLAAAAAVHPAVRLVLVGDGPLRTDLERHAAALPPGRVVFAGYREDVADVLAAADLVVHPSHFDALPTALLSALAAGRPVVGTDVGGIPEVVTPDVGLLVPARDPAALGRALDALARDPDRRRRLGGAARLRFEEEFDARVWAARLRAVYDEVLVACPA